VIEQDGTLADALSRKPQVIQHLERTAIDHMTDPANYLGMAPLMANRAVAASKRQGSLNKEEIA
jgi:3-carboxy-cis,cis-muconate cycloisomerase